MRFMIELPLDLAKKAAADLHIETEVWKWMVKEESSISSYRVADVIKDYKEREVFWKETFPTWPMILQMLLMLANNSNDNLIDWSDQFDKVVCILHLFMIESLKPFGYNIPEQIPEGILDYNSEVYAFLREGK